jgi:hypothetical protein
MPYRLGDSMIPNPAEAGPSDEMWRCDFCGDDRELCSCDSEEEDG